MRLILKLSLTALCFMFVLPQIHGISFHGGFGSAFLVSIVFGLMLWLVDMLAVTVSAMITIGSFGLALLWLVPLWLLGFWILPAVSLRLVADAMPQYLTITGWLPAIIAGLLMMIIGSITSAMLKKKDN